MNREVIRTSNFAGDGAALILREARAALAERGEFRIALSGGNTPRPIYAEFGRIARDLPWERVRFTFGDERCVPPDDAAEQLPDGARERCSSRLAVPEKSVLRMRGEIDPHPRRAGIRRRSSRFSRPSTARRFIATTSCFSEWATTGTPLRFFPAPPRWRSRSGGSSANYVPKLDAWRLTMTLPLLNQSRHVLFLVSGEKNPELLERVLAGDSEFPAAQVNPPNGELTWMIGERA